MPFARVYPLYIAKVERKGHAKSQVDEAIRWLTGFAQEELEHQVEAEASFVEFFNAATINERAPLITGVICGVRIEEIEDPLMKKIRYMDKLIDEIAKGLKVTASSADGLVEGLEHTGSGQWLLGVQWHPEDTASTDPAQQSLYDELVKRSSRRV